MYVHIHPLCIPYLNVSGFHSSFFVQVCTPGLDHAVTKLTQQYAAEEEDSDTQSEDEVSQHDEACSICHRADDMDMLLCDGCLKVFHLSCLGLAKVPPDEWLCAVCKDEA